MAKRISVASCSSCPHFRSSQIWANGLCQHPSADPPSSSTEVMINKIPDWCPLEEDNMGAVNELIGKLKSKTDLATVQQSKVSDQIAEFKAELVTVAGQFKSKIQEIQSDLLTERNRIKIHEEIIANQRREISFINRTRDEYKNLLDDYKETIAEYEKLHGLLPPEEPEGRKLDI